MMGELGIYKVNLKGTRVMWAVIWGVAYSESEATQQALKKYIDDDPTIKVVRCKRQEEVSFLPSGEDDVAM